MCYLGVIQYKNPISQFYLYSISIVADLKNLLWSISLSSVPLFKSTSYLKKIMLRTLRSMKNFNFGFHGFMTWKFRESLYFILVTNLMQS